MLLKFFPLFIMTLVSMCYNIIQESDSHTTLGRYSSRPETGTGDEGDIAGTGLRQGWYSRLWCTAILPWRLWSKPDQTFCRYWKKLVALWYYEILSCKKSVNHNWKQGVNSLLKVNQYGHEWLFYCEICYSSLIVDKCCQISRLSWPPYQSSWLAVLFIANS